MVPRKWYIYKSITDNAKEKETRPDETHGSKIQTKPSPFTMYNSYQCHTNDLLTRSSKTKYERTTGELTI